MDRNDENEEMEVERRPTEGVRIVGATEAGDLVREDAGSFEDSSVPEWSADDVSVAPATDVEMPHWTQPATGEVPAVLAELGGEATSAVAGPTWTDDGTGWQDDDFDHSLLAGDDEDDEGVLGESGPAPEEMFSFDNLDDPSGPTLRSGVFGEALDTHGGRDSHLTGPRETAERDVTAAVNWSTSDGLQEGSISDSGSGSGVAEGDDSSGLSGGLPGVGSVVGERRTVRIGSSGRSTAPPLTAQSRGQGRTGKPRRSDRDVGVAIAVGLAIGALIVVLFLFGSATALLVVTVVVTLGIAEYFAVMRRAGYQPASLLGLIATVCLMVAAYEKGEAAVSVVVSIMVIFTLLWYLWGVTGDRPGAGVAVTLLGFMWVGFLGSFSALLLSPKIHPERHGVALLFGAIVATVAYDVAAYATGSRIGKHPLAPRISPNKTWEGLAAGMLSSVIVSVVFISHLHPWSPKRALALGIVVAVAAPLGDLCQSMIKRDAGVKDMSSMLPGHGGVLDRIDAMLFVMPAVYFLARVLNIS